MKNLKIYILAATVFATVGCSKDFLDKEDVTTVTDANFYKTPADAYKALVGCYDGMQRSVNDASNINWVSEVMSDNAFGGTGNADGLWVQMLDEFNKLRAPTEVNTFNGNWNNSYNAILRCNMLIKNINNVSWGTDTALKATYESEARFIRASVYFDMVRMFGNIPLVTEPTKDVVPQANPDEVYKLIASDLKFAAENLPSVNYSSQAPATYGRVTKWAAKSLIGRAYLYYTGYYSKPDLAGIITQAEALAHLEDVITNSGHGLVAEFKNLWPASLDKYVGENNKETVFAIKYTFTSTWGGNTDGNHWMVMNGIRGLTGFYPYGQGWGGATVTPKLWNAFAANDTRKVASIISIAGEAVPFGEDQRADQREYTGYTNKKYTPLNKPNGKSVTDSIGGENSFMISQFQDFVVIRYSDVLLMAAELGSTKAQQYFDEVRARAGLTPLPVNKENIMQERRFEFVGEGIRYWDLLRQGLTVAGAAVAENTTVLNGDISTPKVILASNLQQTKGLLQIPKNQIDLSNGVLKQNEGW